MAAIAPSRRRVLSPFCFSKFLHFLLLLCFLSFANAAVMNIGGNGATTLEPLVSILDFSYRSVNPAVNVAYKGTGSGQGRSTIISPLSVVKNLPYRTDYGASNTLFTNAELSTARKNQRAPAWALLGSLSATVLSYNLPDIDGSVQLTLSREAVVGIFNATLLYWDDPRIVALNPSVASKLPHRRINIIVRGDRSGTTNTFLQALRKFDPAFPVAPVDLPASWPFTPNFTSSASSSPLFSACPEVLPTGAPQAAPQGYFCTGIGNSQGAALLMFHPYSVAYMGMPFYLQSSGLNYFALVNRAGRRVNASSSSIQSSITYAKSMNSLSAPASSLPNAIATNTSPIGDLNQAIDAPTVDGWPIAEFNFWMVPNILSSDCDRAMNIAQYLIWSISSSTAQEVMRTSGYVPLTDDIADIIVNQITNLRCGTLEKNSEIFENLFPEEIIIIGIGYAGAAAFCALGALLIFLRSHPAIIQFGFRVSVFQAFGLAINSLSVLVLTGYPTQVECSLRPWLYSFEIVMACGLLVTNFRAWIEWRDSVAPRTTSSSVLSPARSGAVVDDGEFISAIDSSWEEYSLDAFEQHQQLQKQAVAVAALEVKRKSVAMISDDDSSPLAGDASFLSIARGWVSDFSSYCETTNGKVFQLCFVLASIWFINLFIWFGLQAPVERQRQCVGTMQAGFRLVQIVFHLCLIAATLFFSQKANRFNVAMPPCFVLLFVIALFEPLAFLRSQTVYWDRQVVTLILQPSVGVLVSTLFSAAFVFGPMLKQAFENSAEDMLIRIRLELELAKFRATAERELTRN